MLLGMENNVVFEVRGIFQDAKPQPRRCEEGLHHPCPALAYLGSKKPSEQVGRAMGERGSSRRPRSHHNWGARFGRHRAEMKNTEPTGLLQLESLAQRAAELMEKYSPKSEQNYHNAMDLLRLQYNMNFIVVCEKCRGPHIEDEIIAPER